MQALRAEQVSDTPHDAGAARHPASYDRQMAGDLTDAQVRNGAKAISYRAKQLADVAIMITLKVEIQIPPRFGETVTNAVLEGALTNARALAYFFMERSDIRASMFHSEWDNDLAQLTRTIESTVSRHLSHATTGAKDGEVHPGAWPVIELAVVLVGGLARFMELLDKEEAASFVPAPVPIYNELIRHNPTATPTDVSQNASVGELTKALQDYLRLTTLTN